MQYGINLDAVGLEVNAEDGSRWEANSDIHLPVERFWLVEKATANQVVFIRQLFSADGSSVERHDIQITAERQDGEWVVSKAEVLGVTEPAVVLE